MLIKPTLVILAAGMASRYGSLKQMDAFGPHGETIIDFSIYDAIRAGFGKIVFIIREEFHERMREVFEGKLKDKIDYEFAFQDFDMTKYGIHRSVERTKPWGTAHAVLSAKNNVTTPFCVINADDFYGFDAFDKMAKFLMSEVTDQNMSLMGFEVGNTMSDHGYVSRGVCEVSEEGDMLSVTERTKIYYQGDEKNVVYEENGQTFALDPKSPVSMNFWGFTPRVFEKAEEMLHEFVEKNWEDPKSEFFIPSVADQLVRDGEAVFKVIPTSAKWFGVTYPDDKPIVEQSIAELIAKGAYPSRLF